MRITKNVHLVGDGGRGLSHDLDCCVYSVNCGGAWVMIDAGVGLHSETIASNMKEDNIDIDDVKCLIATHSHSDHACGIKFFQDNLQVEVLAPDVEAKLIQSGSDEELGLDTVRGPIYPTNYKYIHSKADRVLSHGEGVKIGNKIFRLIQVPGHSPGSSCILIKEERILFSGDVLFHGGTIGVGNWLGFSLTEYRRNIHRLAGLGVQQLFPGHFMLALRDGQKHIDKAIENLRQPWVPPAWQHNHPHF